MLNSIINGNLTVSIFFICTGVSVILGIATACLSMFKSKCTQSFAITLAILPAVVQIVIMLVNGNIGAGVAVAGAFSLVRFRSAPGTAKEIGVIFLAMCLGLATGMGYVVMAVIFFVIIALIMVILNIINFAKPSLKERTLKITIPDNLNYDNVFDDIFYKYTKSFSLDKVKTTSLGTLFELQYTIVLKTNDVPKEFIDELRCRNANLNIVCTKEVYTEVL